MEPLPLPTGNYAFADALLVLEEHELDEEVRSLRARWSDVEIPIQAGITRPEET